MDLALKKGQIHQEMYKGLLIDMNHGISKAIILFFGNLDLHQTIIEKEVPMKRFNSGLHVLVVHMK